MTKVDLIAQVAEKTGLTKKDSEKVVTAVLDTITENLANGEKVNVTISVGVATVGENGKKPQEMIEYADKCLYIAKENGRNQVVHEAN